MAHLAPFGKAISMHDFTTLKWNVIFFTVYIFWFLNAYGPICFWFTFGVKMRGCVFASIWLSVVFFWQDRRDACIVNYSTSGAMSLV